MHDTITTIEAGREVVGVKLGNHPDRAWLFREDYDVIVARFGCSAWFVNKNGHGQQYVRLRDSKIKNLRSLARQIMGEAPRTAVRHNDGNTLNLRRENLVHIGGTGGITQRKRDKSVSIHRMAHAPL